MFDKFFKEGKSKDIIIKLITIAVIASVLLGLHRTGTAADR